MYEKTKKGLGIAGAALIGAGLIGLLVRKKPLPPADIQLSNLVISPGEIYLGDSAVVSVTVTNTGGQAGSYTVVMEVT